MDPNFCFDVASSDEEAEPDDRAVQSLWEFASYSESVAEEHARRNTTSVDAKISKILQECAVSHPDNGVDEQDESKLSDALLSCDELVKEEHKHNKGDNRNSGGREASFFALHNEASFHANSFLELNLSRPSNVRAMTMYNFSQVMFRNYGNGLNTQAHVGMTRKLILDLKLMRKM